MRENIQIYVFGILSVRDTEAVELKLGHCLSNREKYLFRSIRERMLHKIKTVNGITSIH